MNASIRSAWARSKSQTWHSAQRRCPASVAAPHAQRPPGAIGSAGSPPSSPGPSREAATRRAARRRGRRARGARRGRTQPLRLASGVMRANPMLRAVLSARSVVSWQTGPLALIVETAKRPRVWTSVVTEPSRNRWAGDPRRETAPLPRWSSRRLAHERRIGVVGVENH